VLHDFVPDLSGATAKACRLKPCSAVEASLDRRLGLRLLRPATALLATASEGAPGRGSFEAQIAFPPPFKAPTDARVQVYSESSDGGSVQNLVSVPFVIWHVLPPIYIDSPLCGDEVKSPATVAVSYAIEGQLIVVIKDSSGKELARARQTMGSGRSTMSQELDFSLSGGPQAGTVEAFSSPREGIIENIFSVPVTLVP
jgi:hypothetical protein